ncbi:hypothetical protein CC86DRAFT_114775 [Ophiobolus disseminans]|uniref:Heterokaryon incompatibility domain-containing protein n=1 Tax=Ophiobolus disseminans TaxID=1469910 RepID=A0A6A6ZHD6_9PLEO|nr:hypothetical protein CC86DRAFT_114775 [Ophiobolus disseminans]
MKNDLHKTFGEIFKDDISALLKQLVEIQQYQNHRNESLEWALKLRFLDISRAPNLARVSRERDIWSVNYGTDGEPIQTRADRPKLSIPIVEEDDSDEPPVYMAVSWKWVGRAENVPFGCNHNDSFRYYIRRPGSRSRPHATSFPDKHMDRVIQVAQSQGITKIWIDTECIYQRDGDGDMYPRDKELGVQVMDLVYEDGKMSVGLLTTPLIHQGEVDTLASLLNGDIFVGGHTKSFAIKPHVDVSKVQMLILRILSDPRWSRAWIFQEDHLASYGMTLLIPHSEHIDTTKMYDFGNVTGELQVKMWLFRECVTAFCLAQPDIQRWPTDEILRKAKRYKTFNSTSLEMYPTTTYPVLSDICSRSIEKEEDRIAILANALRFSTRLDTSDASPLVSSDNYSLSAILFALILLNGEILYSNDDILHHTVQSYLKESQFVIKAPHPRREQYFIDHCRFRNPTITMQGIETQGWLFELFVGRINSLDANQGNRSNCISLSQIEKIAVRNMRKNEDSQAREPRSILNKVDQAIVEMIVSKLDEAWPQCRLVELMRRNLRIDRKPPPHGEEDPATSIMLKMMAAVVQTLEKGQEARLARPVSEPQDSPPSALFISPQDWSTDDKQDAVSPMYVYTSWDNPRGKYRQERLASLEVAPYDKRHWAQNGRRLIEGSFLRSYAWVNGIWDARGKPMEKYVFPFVGDGARTSTKRKRVDEDEDE